MKPFKVCNNYVFIVYEFPKNKKEIGWIHGVYINEAEAIGKCEKLMIDRTPSLAILKKPLQGKSRDHASMDTGKSVYIQIGE